jgi:hypothetical protein
MKNSPEKWSLLESVSRWMRNTLDKHGGEAALMDREEVARIASDLNLSVSELRNLCDKHGGTPERLQQRLSQLHLDRSEIKHEHPGVLRDLEKVCALCASEARCSRDFERHAAPEAWTEYCPNSSTLEDLQQETAAKPQSA